MEIIRLSAVEKRTCQSFASSFYSITKKFDMASVASSVYAVITAVISHLITHGSTDPLLEYALNSTAVIYLLNNTYSVIRHKYARMATRDYT